MDTDPDLTHAILKLKSYARARDRATEREPRTVTLTDDEALALLERLEELRDSPGSQ